jgi:hypothetical protein
MMAGEKVTALRASQWKTEGPGVGNAKQTDNRLARKQ